MTLANIWDVITKIIDIGIVWLVFYFILKNIRYCIFKKGQNPDTVYLNENIYKKVNEREQS